MQARTMMIGVLAGGPLLGLLVGLSVNRGMPQPPEPSWRSQRPEPTFSAPRPVDDSDWVPLGVGAAFAADRTPTWKRHPTERQAISYADAPAAVAEPRVDYAEPGAEPGFEDAAAGRDAATDARTAATDQDDAPAIAIAAPDAGT